MKSRGVGEIKGAEPEEQLILNARITGSCGASSAVNHWVESDWGESTAREMRRSREKSRPLSASRGGGWVRRSAEGGAGCSQKRLQAGGRRSGRRRAMPRHGRAGRRPPLFSLSGGFGGRGPGEFLAGGEEAGAEGGVVHGLHRGLGVESERGGGGGALA